jgi:HSP20 family protein
MKKKGLLFTGIFTWVFGIVFFISGERNYEAEEQDANQGFYRMERRFGSFSRRLPLPDDATPAGVDAQYEKGVLEINIPKKEPAEPKKESRRIKIG